jgi:myo-inositol-1(or 4)-monophosphatase
MKDITLSHLLDTALCAAEAAGKHAQANKHRRTETTDTFKHDIKLVLDVECQAIAEEVIASEFPRHSILGEEGSRHNSISNYEWVIDPIDGTLNYSHNFPYWCSSVAVRYNDKVVAGCVYAPELNKFYTAHIEEPAKLNGEPIHTSEERVLEDALIFSGLSKNLQTGTSAHIDFFRKMAVSARKIRVNGAAALDLCHVAEGVGDGYVETGIHIWDYAAAGLIAEQAGGSLALYPRHDVPDTYGVLCANEQLITPLRRIYTHFF